MRVFKVILWGAAVGLSSLQLSVCDWAHAAGTTTESESAGYIPLSAGAVAELTSPIAFYPDILLQAILPASTFPDQIVDAALLIKNQEDAAKIKDQAWDSSVKVVATYPGVLKMMFEDIEWTTGLGQAFLNQHKDVMASIQKQRVSAQKAGTLASNEQQKVTSTTVEGGTTIVQIQPADPEVVYVPTSTTVVSDNSYNSSSALVPLASFGLGMALGSALNDDDDNYYYGGGGYWGGGGGYWYNDDNFDKWQDNRRAVWEDHNDRAWDRQEHRQDMAGNRQDFRQDMYEQGKTRTPEQRQQARSDFNQKHPNAAQNASQRREAARTGGTTAGQARTTARSSNTSARATSANAESRARMQQSSTKSTNRGWSSSTTNRSSNKQGSGAFSGYDSRKSTSAYSSRGASSRSSAGYSRSNRSYSGSSRSGSMSRSSSMSRGGGGSRGGRGGGGGGRRR